MNGSAGRPQVFSQTDEVEALVDDSTKVTALEALAGVPEVLLLEALIKLHGWWVLEPGTLRRPWQRPRVHHFMNPEGL